MSLKRIALLLMTIFALGGPVLAQSDQEILTELKQAARLVNMKYATSKSMVDISRMANDSQGYQLAQFEMQYHEQFYNYLEHLAHNMSLLRSPQGVQDYNLKLWEYDYRTSHRDYRPGDQISGSFQQWVAQRQWETSTQEGQQAYNNRRQAAESAFQAQQANHAQANAAFDSYMTGLRNDSNQRDKYQHQYVNTIHDQYEYVNPYDGQGYLYPNTTSGNPVMQNPDGSYTQLIPYQNY